MTLKQSRRRGKLCLPDVLPVCCSVFERGRDIIKAVFLVALLCFAATLGFAVLWLCLLFMSYSIIGHVSDKISPGHDRKIVVF